MEENEKLILAEAHMLLVVVVVVVCKPSSSNHHRHTSSSNNKNAWVCVCSVHLLWLTNLQGCKILLEATIATQQNTKKWKGHWLDLTVRWENYNKLTPNKPKNAMWYSCQMSQSLPNAHCCKPNKRTSLYKYYTLFEKQILFLLYHPASTIVYCIIIVQHIILCNVWANEKKKKKNVDNTCIYV